MVHSLAIMKCRILHSPMVLPVVKKPASNSFPINGGCGSLVALVTKIFLPIFQVRSKPIFVPWYCCPYLSVWQFDIVRLAQSPFNRGHGSLGLLRKIFLPGFKDNILLIIFSSVSWESFMLWCANWYFLARQLLLAIAQPFIAHWSASLATIWFTTNCSPPINSPLPCPSPPSPSPDAWG